MDPLSAVSLAGNIVQLVDYSAKAVFTFSEIRQSVEGSVKSNDELELISNDLKKFVGYLAGNLELAQDPQWSNICTKCASLGVELLSILESCKAGRGRDKRLDSLKASIKVLAQRGKIRDLESRMRKLREEICARVTSLLLQQRSGLAKSVDDFGANFKEWQESAESKLDKLTESLANIEALEDKNASKDSPGGEQAAFGQFADMFTAYVERAETEQRIRRILQGLHFKQLRTRGSEVKEAHRTTFEWIFNAESNTRFAPWLEDEQSSDIYWISGKAGSGKSTLMKFLLGHERTHSGLQKWAEQKDLVVASHFFWSSGTPLQKTQEGLFRTVLFQILLQCPHLAPLACPRRWNHKKCEDLESWTLSELIGSFKGLLTEELNVRICLFIDGLDEYHGNHSDLIKALEVISQSSSIKICASSRPWIPFLKAFQGRAWQLAVQDLTQNDILVYIKDNLEADSHFQTLHRDCNDMAGSLILQIASRAQGVFLWVYLVVRSLLKGLANYDSLADLHWRLNELPDDLEKYFKLMLDSIEPVYVGRTARVFRTLAQANSSLPVITFHFLDKEERCRDYALDPTEFNSANSKQFENMESMKSHQLIAQCGDLIHISHTPDSTIPWRHNVAFLHRTVTDFLRTREMAAEIASRTGPDFSPCRSLCRAYLAILKVPNAESGNNLKVHVRRLVASIMHNALELEEMSERPEIQVLDELARHFHAIQNDAIGSQLNWTKVIDVHGCHSLACLAVRCGMSGYVQSLLARQKTREAGAALLREALRRGITIEEESGFSTVELSRLDLTMAATLIRKGVSPNDALPDKKLTVWEDFLLDLETASKRVDDEWNMSRFLTSEPQNSHYHQFMSKECAYGACKLMAANGAEKEVRAGHGDTAFYITLKGEENNPEQPQKDETILVWRLFDEFFTPEQVDSLMATFPRILKDTSTRGILTRAWYSIFGEEQEDYERTNGYIKQLRKARGW